MAVPGTLAIDLGSSTTVVAFQPREGQPALVALPPYSLEQPPVVPSLLWLSSPAGSRPLIGRQVLEAGLESRGGPELQRDFKRRIGGSDAAEQAGSLLLQHLWRALPSGLEPERLVLTAPVESVPAYRRWLQQLGQELGVAEVALVDEPTAAAIGAGLPPGSTVLVADLGGGTIDLSLVRLPGGEGRAAPIAQLLRFGGRNLAPGGQALRGAEVLGKAGLVLGGRDIDSWIAATLAASLGLEGRPPASLLAAAERLKHALSDADTARVIWSPSDGQPRQLEMDRRQLEALLEQNGLLLELNLLLDGLLAAGRRAGVGASAITAILPVGGSSRMPWVRRWLEERCPGVPIRGERPVEAVVLGALALTPGVQLRDVLSHGVALRCWDRRSGAHHWHPLFQAGQSWPTQQPLELVLACGQSAQPAIELVLGEPLIEGRREVVFSGGLPQLRARPAGSAPVELWSRQPQPIRLDPPGTAGEDRLRLSFAITAAAELTVQVRDLLTGSEGSPLVLGSVR